MFLKGFYIFLATCLYSAVCWSQAITPANPDELCEGGSVVLTAAGAPGGSTFQWRKDEADIQGATSRTYRVIATGSYDVIVTSSGIPITYSAITVTVNPKPVADFTYSQTGQCSTVPIHFTNTSTGTGLTYSWNFGDPGSGSSDSSKVQNPTHVFVGSPGSGTQAFTVRLTVTSSSGCTAVSTKPVVVKRLPDATLTGTGFGIYMGKPFFTQCQSTSSTFNFRNISSTITTNTAYRIKWGDGNPDYTSLTFNAPITHNFPIGIDTLLFIVTGNDNCIDTSTYYVFVGVDPNVGLAGGASNICTQTALTFSIDQTLTSLNPKGTAYTATFNDGTPPIIFGDDLPATITHTFVKESCGAPPYSRYTNAFFASVVASNPCGNKEAIIVPIHVSSKPIPSFSVSPGDTVCVNKAVTINNTSVNNQVTNGNCTAGNSIWKITPSTGWTYTGSLGNDFGLPDPSAWLSGSSSLSLNFSATGKYEIKLKTGNATCGKDSITKTICVNELPTASFSLDKDIGCAPLTVKPSTVTNTSFCGAFTYKWTVTYAPAMNCVPSGSNFKYIQGSDASREPTFQFLNPGIYTVGLEVIGPGGSCSTATIKRVITVKGKPNITSIGIPTSICQFQSITPVPVINCYVNADTSYFWSFAGGRPLSYPFKSPGQIFYDAAGTYPVSLRATNVCGDSTVTQQLIVNPIPASPTAGSNSPVCSGDILQLSSATVSTGTITYSWTGPGNFSSTLQNPVINNVTGAASGTYYVTVTSNGCTSLKESTIVVINAKPAPPTAQSNSPVCNGGVLRLTSASANTGNITYAWTGPNGFSSPLQNPEINNVTLANQGVYSVVAMQDNCQSLPATATVTIRPGPTISSSSFSNPVTCASSTGTITLTGLSPLVLYTVEYIKNGGDPTAIGISTNTAGVLQIPNLSAGFYSNVTVALNGCQSGAADPFTLSDPNPPPPQIAASNSPLCSGSTLNLTSVATTTGATYSWTGPNSFTSTLQNPTIVNAGAAASGTYFVTVKSNGCTSSPGSVDVLISPKPETPTVESNSPLCSGEVLKLGAVSSTSGNITYTWTGPNSFTSSLQNPEVINVPVANSGLYSVVAKAGNCESPAGNVPVTIKPTPNIITSTFTNPTTCATSTGSIILNGLSPLVSYTVEYIKNGGAPTIANISSNVNGVIVIQNLSAGLYDNVTVTLNSCESGKAGPFILSDPNPPAPPAPASNSPLCNGSTLNLTSGAATAGATYIWTGPNGFTSTLQNPTVANTTTAASGTYYVTVQLDGCTSSTGSTEVVISAKPEVPTVESNSPLCGGDVLRLNAVSATSGNITYTWTGPNGFSSSLQNPEINKATTANSGLYSVVAMEGNCQSLPGNVTVTIRPTPSISSSTFTNPTTCASSTGTITLDGLSPFVSYTVEYTNNGGAPTTINVASNANGVVVLRNLSAGLYDNVTLTFNGCQSGNAGPFTLSDPNQPAAPTAASNGPLCSGSTLNLTSGSASLGVAYSWTGPNGFTSTLQNPTITNVQAAASGTYYVTVKLNGCTSSPGSADVLISPKPETPTVVSNNLLCGGDTLRLNAVSTSTENVTYAWSGPNGFSSSLQNPVIDDVTTANSGLYSVIVLESNCESLPGTQTVTIKPTPNISSSTFTNPTTCASSTGSITLNGLAVSVVYTVEYTRNGGTPTVMYISSSSTGVLVIRNLSAGLYDNVTVTFNGCKSGKAGPFTLSDPNQPATPTAASNGPLCSGSTLNLISGTTTTGAVKFNWTGPNGFVSSSQNPTITNATTAASGTYYVSVQLNGCTSLPGLVEVLISSKPEKPTVASNSPLCSGDTLRLSSVSGADENITYTWTGPDGFSSTLQNPEINNVSAANVGLYSVIAVQGNCVSAAGTASVLINPAPNINSSTFTHPTGCGFATGTITLNGLTASTLYTILYTKNGVASSPVTLSSNSSGVLTITGLTAGTYTEITAALNNCQSNEAGPFTLEDSSPASPTAGSNGPLCVGSTLNLTAGTSSTGAITYSWTGPNGFTSNAQNPGKSNVSLADTGTYYVTVTANGCSSGANVFVAVDQKPVGGNTGPDTILCTGPNTGTIYLTNHSGLISRWDSSKTQGASWGAIDSITSSITYDNLDATTWYRAVLQSGVCPETYSDTTIITVVKAVTPSNAGEDQELCNVPSITLNGNKPATGVGIWEQVSGVPAIITDPTLYNTTVTRLQAGYSRFTWTVSSGAQCINSSDTVNVTVWPLTTTATAGADQTVCDFADAHSITLNANADTSRNFEKEQWKILSQPQGGNGRFNNSLIPTSTFTFNQPGTYELEWTISNDSVGGCPAGRDTMNIYVFEKPEAGIIIPSSTNVCAGTNVTVSADPANGKIKRWQYNPVPLTDNNWIDRDVITSLVSFDDVQDSFAVRVIIESTGALKGCNETDTSNTVIINVSPASVGGTSTSDTSVCKGNNEGTITLSGYQGVILGWQTSADGIVWPDMIDNVTPYLTYINLGVTTWYRAVVKSGVCDTAYSSPTKITVTDVVTQANAGVDQQLCNATKTTLNGNQPKVGIGEWIQTLGPTATIINKRSQNAVVDNLLPDTLYRFKWLIVSVMSASDCDSSFDEVEIRNSTGVTTPNAGADVVICDFTAPRTITLNANSNPSRVSEIAQWSIISAPPNSGSLSDPSSPNSTFSFSQPGTYKLLWTISNNFSQVCSSLHDTLVIYAYTPLDVPHPVFEPALISTCDHDTTIQFTVEPGYSGNDSINYKWFINNLVQGTTNPFSFRFVTPGNNTGPALYNIKVLAQTAAGCGDTSLPGLLKVYHVPQPSIQVNPGLIQQQPDYTFTFKDIAPDNANADYNYIWNMGDGSLQTRTGREVTYQYGDSGTYQVKLLVTDFVTGCQSVDSVKVKILYVPGYLQVPNAICPGCSNNSLRQFLPLAKGLKQYRLRIFSGWGKLLFETTSLAADGSPNEPWTTQYKGGTVQQDVYQWQIEARFINGTEWKGMVYKPGAKPVKAGFITVIK